MKKITVEWQKSDSVFDKIYDSTCMRVIKSNHPRFVEGSRFDYGFMGIATTEGYIVTVKPLKQPVKKWTKSHTDTLKMVLIAIAIMLLGSLSSEAQNVYKIEKMNNKYCIYLVDERSHETCIKECRSKEAAKEWVIYYEAKL